jgi:hypothetical protein
VPARTARSLTWMQRLERVFDTDLRQCPRCGGAVRVIGEVIDPVVVGEILAHLAQGQGPGANRATVRPGIGSRVSDRSQVTVVLVSGLTGSAAASRKFRCLAAASNIRSELRFAGCTPDLLCRRVFRQ